MINLPLFRLQKNQEAEHLEKKPSLCDNLRYLAGDYPLYVADDGSCFEIYMEQLKKWYESEFCHDKVRAIYYYLQKKSLMHD